MFKPNQLEKNKNKEWYEANAKYWKQKIPLIDETKIISRLEKACGKIKEKDYSYVTEPYNTGQSRKMPAKMQNVDIISPIIKQLIGEYLKRPVEGIAYNKNSDLNNKKAKMQHELIVESLQQVFVNQLIKLGLFVEGQVDEQGQPVRPPLSIEAIEKEVSNIVDEKTINAQFILDYLFNTTDILSVLKEIFYFYATTGIGLSYKDIVNGNIIYKLVKPRNFGYIASEDTRYIEDAEATVAVYTKSLSECVEFFGDFEDFDKILNYLESDRLGDRANASKQDSFNGMFFKHFRSNKDFVETRHTNITGTNADDIKVEHFQWKSLTTIYRVYLTDEEGKESFVDYDCHYVPLDSDVYEKRTCVCREEVYIIDDEYVVGGQEVEFSRGDYENPNVCPGSYSGVIVQSYLDSANTIIDMLDVYQENYNVVKFIIQKTINKNKDKIATIPLSLVNGFKTKKQEHVSEMDIEGKFVKVVQDNSGSAIAETLYFADATQFMFIDDSELTPQQANVASQLLKQIDLGLGSYIQYLYDYALQIKEEAYENVGFNRYRRAATGSSDAVYNAQQGQYIGSLLTEELFEDFRRFCEKEFTSLIDLSKYVWNTGLKATFIKSDYETASIDIPPNGLSHANIGVVVKQGGEVKQQLEDFKRMLTGMGGNNLQLSTVAKIMSKTSNFSTLIKELELKEKEMMESSSMAQQEAIRQKDIELELKTRELDITEKKVDGELELRARELGVEPDNSLQIIDSMNKKTQQDKENLLKLGELQIKKEGEATKRFVAEKSFQIAKENK